MGDFSVRELDAHDDMLIDAFSDVRRRAAQDGRPAVIPPDPDTDRAMLRDRPEHQTHRFQAYGAFDGDRMVGAGWVTWPLLDNTDRVFCIVSVPPEERRRGVASMLLGHVAGQVRARGRSIVWSLASCHPTDLEMNAGAFGFSTAVGASVARLDVRRSLALPMDEDRLRALEAEAESHTTRYRIETFRGSGSRYWASYVALRNLLVVEAPAGDLEFEAQRITPDALSERRADEESRGNVTWTTVAVLEDDVVAYTEMALDATSVALVIGTLVRPEHRGHRLGLAVKVANLRRIVLERPDIEQVITENAEVNAHMVAINERFGFEVVALAPVMVLRV